MQLSREAFVVSALQMFALVAATLIPAAVAGQSLDGIWRSRGYGFVFDIHGDEWKVFGVASTRCVAGFTATRSGGPAADREATFTIGGRRPLYIRRGGSNDHNVLHFDGSGIPPDIRIPVFAAADVSAEKDPAMAKALEILASARGRRDR